MRHLPIVIIFVLMIILVCNFTWKNLAIPENERNKSTIEPTEPGIESMISEKRIPIKDSEMLMGENVEIVFKQIANKQIVKIQNLKDFLELNPSSIFRGWVIKNSPAASKIYWTVKENKLYYYYPKRGYQINKQSILTPISATDIHRKSNFWTTFLMTVEIIAGLCLLCFVDHKFFKENNKIMLKKKERVVFPAKMLSSNPSVIVDVYDYLHYWGTEDSSMVRLKTFLLLKNGERLGYADFRIASTKYEEQTYAKNYAKEFLKKFGKRLKFDDILDDILLLGFHKRYQMRFQTLVAACKNFQRSPEEFIKNVREAKNETEFVVLAGIF